MSEQYQIAAWRHYQVSEKLEAMGFFDDAGYHYGVAGENAVKFALQASGVEFAWVSAGVNLRKTPMREHFPTLQSLSSSIAMEIALYAKGRLAGAIARRVTHAAFGLRFSGWKIDIRYADTTCTPVMAATCVIWRKDAEELLLDLAL